MLLQAGVADVFVAHENVDLFADPALRADGMLRFAVTSRQHILKRRVVRLACLLQFLVFFPFEDLAAQTPQSSSLSFEEVAAEADATRDRNEIPRAIELYTQALQLNAKWEDGWWSLGVLHYGSGAYDAAADALTHLLALHPDEGQALALRGLSEFETGDFMHSLADIEKGFAFGAADDARHEQILRYHEAMLLTRLGRFAEALRVYSAFAEHKLSSPELLEAIGLAGLRMPLLPKDTSTDQQALLTAAGDATYKFMQGDQAAAQQAFNNLFERFPAARNAHYHYGTLLLAFGPEAAAPQFKKELDVAPDNTDALISFAWALLMQRRADEALPYARRIAQELPERAVSELVLGRALLETQNVATGIEHLQSGIKREPDNLELHIALAKAYAKSGRDEEARRERALCLQMTRNGATHP
jgi:tetratricopeptide (TPR) repeat protein